ncbi:MAG: hypothetical protein H5T34_04015 [Candidatus Methanomethyliales bacterium]|nr:hypothetical protein [Candidatus Methanomethylicales archaeon]
MAKGISEIVATLMMLTIVSGIGIALYAYSMGYFTTTTSALSEVSRMNANTMKERFVVVDVVFRSSGGGTEVSAAVYNYGKIGVTLQMMFLNGTQLTINEVEEVPPSGLIWFNGSVPVIIPKGSLCYLRVVSALGNVYETIVVS